MKTYTMHNVSFYNFEPKSIQCMQYEEESSRLALSRADGRIEIWNCRYRPFMQEVFPGEVDRTVEELAWCNGKLFSVGLDGFLLEYNMNSGKVINRTAVTGGATWCLKLSNDKKMFAAGTEEGYVCLFSVHEMGIMYETTLPKQESRILSLAWHSSDKYLVMGSVNQLFLYSFSDKKMSRLGFVKPKGTQIDVWTVAFLDNMTLVSGDSRGILCFWNGNVGVISQTLNTHKAPIMSLVVSKDQESIYAAGVDPSIVQVRYVERKDTWAMSFARNVHTHDVRALALTNDEKLYSGGVDTKLGLSYGPPKVIVTYHAPSYPGTISITRSAEFILFHYKDNMQLWCLGAPGINMRNSSLLVKREPVKVLELKCKGEQMIEWCAASPKGNRVAYVVQGQIRIFNLQLPEAVNKLSVQRIKKMSEEIKESSQILWLSEDKISSLTEDGTIQIINVSDSAATLYRELALDKNRFFKKMQCDPRGNILAVLDNDQVITTFNFFANGKIKRLPKYYSPVTAFGIHPTSLDIVVAYANRIVKEYSIKTSSYTEFSKMHLSKIREEFANRNSVFNGISFDTTYPNLIFLHDDHIISIIKKVDEPHEQLHNQPAKLQRTEPDHSQMNGQTLGIKVTDIKKKNRVLDFSNVENNSVVSVEVDSKQLFFKLPPVLKYKKFGAK